MKTFEQFLAEDEDREVILRERESDVDPKLLKRLHALHPGSFVLPSTDTKTIRGINRGGVVFGPDPSVKQVRGERGECHNNVALYYRDEVGRTPGLRIGTGFYLVKETGAGALWVWREHSWLVLNDRVLETTGSTPEYYVGILLDGDDAMHFALVNS